MLKETFQKLSVATTTALVAASNAFAQEVPVDTTQQYLDVLLQKFTNNAVLENIMASAGVIALGVAIVWVGFSIVYKMIKRSH